MSLIKGIGHTAIRARDIEVTASFYRDVLGFREAFRMDNNDGTLGTIYMHLGPGQFIEIFSKGSTENVEDDGTRIGHCHMCYEVEDIYQAFEEVQKRGVTPNREITRGKSGCLQFWIKDPDGNPIELMQIMPESMQAAAIRKFG